MIRFERSSNQKSLSIFDGDNLILTLTQISSTITNKYNIIEDTIVDMSRVLGEPFDMWISQFLNIYYITSSDYSDFFIEDGLEDEEPSENLILEKKIDKVLDQKLTRYDFLLRNLKDLTFFVDEYLEKKEFDSSRFVDLNKSSKTSIFFDKEDIDQIVKLSCYLKVYSLISNSESLKLDQKLHKKIYNRLLKSAIPDSLDSEKYTVINKLLDIVRTKTYRYSITDKYMWRYIEMMQCKDINDHVIEIFNFVMTNILILCEFDKNPITYFVSVTNESIKWFLRSIYKGSIVYENSISTEDVHTSNINSLRVYSYNDTLGHFKEICANRVYDFVENKSGIDVNGKKDNALTDFQTRMSLIESTSPICEILVFPIVSYALEIPYKYVETLKASRDDSTIMSIYLSFILDKVFKNEYQEFFKLLTYYPTQGLSVYTTYRIKDNELFINYTDQVKSFFNFNTKPLLFDILSSFIGRCSRISQANAFTGERVVGIPLSKIEKEVIYFYNKYFSNQLETQLDEIKELIMSDF
jgi:hypothetical protein